MGQRNVQLSDRDRQLLVWVGEQYTCRADLLSVLMARHSDDPEARARGRLVARVVNRRVQAWRDAGLVQTQTFLVNTPSTVWLTADGTQAAGLPWRPYEPTLATVAHRHAVGLVRAEAEAMGLGWICERELREGLGGRPLHLPDGVVLSKDDRGKEWRTAVEVELTRKTEARVVAILRHLLATYDDVVYRVHPSAMTVVTRSVAALKTGSERIMVRSAADSGRGGVASGGRSALRAAQSADLEDGGDQGGEYGEDDGGDDAAQSRADDGGSDHQGDEGGGRHDGQGSGRPVPPTRWEAAEPDTSMTDVAAFQGSAITTTSRKVGTTVPSAPLLHRGTSVRSASAGSARGQLREGLGGRPLQSPDGVVLSTDDRGKSWCTAVEVELTRKTEARVVAILRHLLATYDDVVYRVHPSAMTVVTRSAAALTTGSERVMIRPYPPPTLSAVA